MAEVVKTDERIVALINSMKASLAFVNDMRTLSQKVQELKQPVMGLLKQIIECCDFIQKYVNQGFASMYSYHISCCCVADSH